ncbi:hypothetical protein FE772_00760 [Lysobacter enzymogenes]|nr:PIN domain-containing protein [Lysobacter enzymogenes]QCW24414.1 hypothetical protein FE772_00760 [Lysobacter enzymogenes]
MRDVLPEFYQPTAADLESLWREATIVLDANVLLELYGLPKDGREALLGLLKELEQRIWIPHQVALEFQRNRLRAIASERDRTEKALEATRSKINYLIEQIKDLELGKRGIDVDPDAVIDNLQRALDATCEVLHKAHRTQLTITVDDPIRDALDGILEGRVGKPFPNQSAIDELCKEGVVRYAHKIPPGFEDESKDDDRYTHAGLVYTNKFGDLLLWQQLLNHAKEKVISKLIFVTLEKKSDWWRIRDKVIVGPHPELLRELASEGGIPLAWIVRLPDFMSQINDHLRERISPEAIDQVEAADASRLEAPRPPLSVHPIVKPASLSMRAVENWLRSLGFSEVPTPPDYPADLAVVRDGSIFSVEVVAITQESANAYHLSELQMRLSIAQSAFPMIGKVRLLFIVLLPPALDVDDLEFSRSEAKSIKKILSSTSSDPGQVDVVVGSLKGSTFVPL